MIIKILLEISNAQKYNWRERMGIADFLMTNTKLRKLFPDHQHIVMALDNAEKDNFAKSKDFLARLEVRYKVKALELVDNNILSFGKAIDPDFSNRERKILKEMLKKQRLIEFDEIADIMWDDPDDYSLWAMNKAMQRLRNKLIELGLPQNTLLTKRKQGYYLNF